MNNINNLINFFHNNKIQLEKKTKDIQEQYPQIIQSSFFHEKKIDLDYSDELFENLICGPFRENPIFSPGQIKKSLLFFENFISLHIKKLEESKYKARLLAFNSQLKNIHSIFDEISKISPSIDEIEKLAEGLFHKYKVEKEVWFPFGWQSSLGGPQFIIGKIDWEKGITLIYSGEQLEAYDCIEKTLINPLTNLPVERKKQVQFLSLEATNKTRLHSKEFILLLLKYIVEPTKVSSIKYHKSLKDFLQASSKKLADPEKYPILAKESSYGKNPVIKTITAALFYTLTGLFEKDFKPNELQDARNFFETLKAEWQIDSLLSICRKKEGRALENEEIQLFENILANLSRQFDKRINKGSISPEDLRKWNATKDEIHHLLLEKKKDPPKNLTELPLGIDPKISDWHSVNYKIKNGTFFHTNKKAGQYNGVPSPLEKFSWENEAGIIDPQQILDKLTWLSICAENLIPPDNKKEPLSKLILCDLLCKLPHATRKSDSFWAQVSPDKILPSMENIVKLMFIISEGSSLNIYSKICNFSLLAIMDLLARRLPDTHLGGIVLNYFPLAKIIQNNSTLISNSTYQKKLEAVFAYFSCKFSLEQPIGSLDDQQVHTLFSWKVSKNEDGFSIDPKTWNNVTNSYFRKFLNKPNIKQEIQEKRLTNPYKQLAYLITSTHLLPASVELLKKASTYCYFDCKRNNNLDPLHDSIDIKNDLFKIYATNQYIIKTVVGYEISTPLRIILRQKRTTPFEQNFVQAQKEISLNSISTSKTVDSISASKTTIKEFGMIPCDPFDEANRALGFLKDHLDLLKHENVRAAIHFHFFRPFRLAIQLKNNPEIGKEIAIFFKEAINHFIYLNEKSAAIDLASLALQIASYGSSENRDFKTLAEEIRHILHNEIQKEDLSYCLALPFAYLEEEPEIVIKDPKLEEKIIIDLCLSKFAKSLFPQNKNTPSAFDKCRKIDENRIDSLFNRFEYVIAKLLNNSPARDQILNYLLKVVLRTDCPQKWEGQYPHYESINKECIIDFSIDHISYLNNKAFVLPLLLQNSRDFWRLCNHSLDNVKFSEQTATFSIQTENRNIIIYRTISDNIHESEPIFAMEIEKDIYIYLSGLERTALINDYPLLVNEESDCWMHSTLNKIIVQNPSNTIIFELKKVDQEFVPTRIIKDQWEWIPFQQIQKQFSFLKDIEPDEKKIGCLSTSISNKTINPLDNLLEGPQPTHLQTIEMLELDRFNLHFKVKNGKLFSVEHQGYFLIPPQPLYPFNHNERAFWLFLENRQGKKKVFLPNTSYEERWLENQIKITPTLDKDKISLIEFSYTNGTLQPRDIEGQLLLFYLLAAKQDFVEAENILNKNKPLFRFSISQENMIFSIARSLSNLGHPDGITLALRLILLKEENFLQYPLLTNDKNDIDEQTAVFSFHLYQQYDQLKLNSTKSLSINAEIDYLSYCERNLSIIQNKALKPIIAEIKSKLRFNHANSHSLTAKKIIPPQPLRFYFITWSKLLNLIPKSEPNDVQVLSWIHSSLDGDFFETAFWDLYHFARSGNSSQRKELKELLDIHSYIDNPEIQEYRDLIELVYHCRYLFPTISTLNSCIKMGSIELRRGIKWWTLQPLKYYPPLRKIVSFAMNNFPIVLPTCRNLSNKVWKKPLQQPLKPLAIDLKQTELEAMDQLFDQFFSSLKTTYFQKTHERSFLGEKLFLSDLSSIDNFSQQVKEKVQNQIDKYHAFAEKNAQKTIAVYEFLDSKQEELFKTTLQTTIETIEQVLQDEKIMMLWELNQINGNLRDKDLEKVKRSGLKQIFTWENIREAFLEGNVAVLCEKCGISKEEGEDLCQKMAMFLVKTTRLQQMRLVYELCSKKEPINQIIKAIDLHRSYSINTENRAKLLFECANLILYRQEQIDKLNELMAHPAKEKSAEMPTGWGKTKAIIGTLIHAFRGTHALFAIHPASLEKTNAEDLQNQLIESYGIDSNRFSFERATNFSKYSLKFTFERLKEDIKQGRPIHARPESIRALQLHYISFLDQLAENDFKEASQKENTLYLAKILQLIRKYGWATIDESHISLYPLDKLIYSLGTSKPLEESEAEVLLEIFQKLSTEKYEKIFKFKQNKQTELTEELYWKTAYTLALEIAENYVKDPEKQDFADYVTLKLKSPPIWFDLHPKKKKIALIKGALAHILPKCSQWAIDKNFGFSKQHFAEKQFAIPYVGANTPKETSSGPSQYKNPHETFIKTLIALQCKGLEKSQCMNLFDFLQKEAIKECQIHRCPIQNTKPYEFFMKIRPEICNKHLGSLNEFDKENIVPYWQKNQEVIFYYAQYIISTQIRQYPYTLISTVQNFRSQFAESISFSATPPDPATIGPDTVPIPMEGTQEHMLHLLGTKCRDIHIVENLSSEKNVETALQILQSVETLHSIVDAGALFKGMKNREIAHKIGLSFEAQKEIELVLFFDEDDHQFKFYNTAAKQCHSLDGIRENIKNRKTFLDQLRSYGSDHPQLHNSEALVTIDKMTTKAIAGQGAGRQRQLTEGQGIRFLIPQNLYQELVRERNLSTEQFLPSLLMYLLANQLQAEGGENFEAQFQQMENEIRSPLMDKLLGLSNDPDATFEELQSIDPSIDLYKKWSKYFKMKENSDPIALYAYVKPPENSKAVLKNIRQSFVDELANISDLGSTEKSLIEKRLALYPERWETINLPKEVESIPLGMQCEVLQEVETQLQVSTEEASLLVRNFDVWKEELDLFENGWENPRRNLTKRIFLVFQKAIDIGKMIVININRAITLTIYRFSTNRVITKIAYAIVLALEEVAVCYSVYRFYKAHPTISKLFLSYLAVNFLAKKWKRKFVQYKSPEIFNVSELLKRHLPESLKKQPSFFSSNFFTTNNYFQQEGAFFRMVPFSNEHKPLFNALLLIDEEKGQKKIKVIAVDQNDTIFIYKKLMKDNENTSETIANARKRKIALYDPLLGSASIQGKNKIEKKELETEEFKRLMFEAKILNRRIPDPEDAPFFEEKMQQFGKKPLLDFLLHVYSAHEENLNHFLQSRWYHLLKGE